MAEQQAVSFISDRASGIKASITMAITVISIR